MKKNDIYVIVFLVFLSLSLYLINFYTGKTGDIAVIYLGNEEYTRLDLDKDTVITVNNTNVIEVKDGEIYMKEANCPDQICVRQGALKRSGREIICLPNKVRIKVISYKSSPDAVSR